MNIPMGQQRKITSRGFEGIGALAPETSDSPSQEGLNNRSVPDRSGVSKYKEEAIFEVRKHGLLEASPFLVLGATTRDSRHRIVELAEEKSLVIDEQVCTAASSALITPSRRLKAEIAWLPGVSPNEAESLVSQMRAVPMQVAANDGLPPIVRANLMACAFLLPSVSGDFDLASVRKEDAVHFLLTFSRLLENVEAARVLVDINEDRAISRFPEVTDIESVEAALGELTRSYCDAARDALNRMDSLSLIDTMTSAVREDTDDGSRYGSRFLHNLVDAYQGATMAFLDAEGARIFSLVASAKERAVMGASEVDRFIPRIKAACEVWRIVARPIQLSLKARGLDHGLSEHVAYTIRSLSLDLFNEHGLVEQAQRVTSLLQELFADVPEVAEVVERDAESITTIVSGWEQSAKETEQWKKRVTYRTQLGVFKQELAISPDGILMNGQHFSLESIVRVRWGGVRKSFNGIPTGIVYTIAVGDTTREAEISLRDRSVNEAFLESLYHGVCLRLYKEMLLAFRDGCIMQFGKAQVSDVGVTMPKFRLFGRNEEVFCDWWHLKVGSKDGSFTMMSSEDRSVYQTLPYIETPNLHLLEALITMNFQNGNERLSAILED
jgi:hypothetical protein